MPAQETAKRPRAADIGLTVGTLAAGPLDAITDVAGVRVGHATLNQGDSVRTGVTVILPHGGNLFRDKVPGAVFVGNAFGKLALVCFIIGLATTGTLHDRWLSLALIVTMVLLCRWQLDVSNSKHFNLQNFGYAFQWWAFSLFVVWMWVGWRLAS